MLFENLDRANYSDDQLAIANFIDKLAKKFDRNYWLNKAEKKEFPKEMWQTIAEDGYFGLIVPEAYGGTHMRIDDLRIFLEEIAGKGLMTLHFVSFFMDCIMVMHGSEALKNKYLHRMAKGEYFSFAITEPDAGTNTFNIKTISRKNKHSYLINGQKVFITGAGESKSMVIVTKAAANERNRKGGLTLLMVDTNSNGITLNDQQVEIVSPDRQYTIFFDEVEVPEENLIGEEGKGFSYLLSGLNLERVMVSSLALGMGKYVLQKAVEYARQRNVFGVPIGAHQAVQHSLTRAFVDLQTATLVNKKAAVAIDESPNSPQAGLYANVAKLCSSEAAFRACDAALQTHGGYGFSKEYDIINFVNSIRLLRIAPVNNEMILNHVGEHFLSLPRSY
ncbi:MAG: acyl-CoA/acyl-ACP dehydrogenase [Deltaproteobacteria bacterium]|nr:acyl-CoA/acyl-ACP dehydrogenase [Deltaproteobacteria bacterium]